MNMKVLKWLWVLLLLTVPARADTYNVTGFDAGGNTVLSGTIDLDNGPVSAVDLTIAYTVGPYSHFAGVPDCFFGLDCASSPQGQPSYTYTFVAPVGFHWFHGHEVFDAPTQTYTFGFDMFGQEGLWFTFSLLDGMISSGGFIADGCGPSPHCPPATFITSGTVLPTPLPATLPLFATGLVGLGLLGWRRKKRAIAA
jgi:hypothetical protein